MDRILTSNGAIRTLDGSGPARLRTSNAEIRVQGLRGSLDAQTSNGSIELIDIAATPRPTPEQAPPEGLREVSKQTPEQQINAHCASSSAGRCAGDQQQQRRSELPADLPTISA